MATVRPDRVGRGLPGQREQTGRNNPITQRCSRSTVIHVSRNSMVIRHGALLANALSHNLGTGQVIVHKLRGDVHFFTFFDSEVWTGRVASATRRAVWFLATCVGFM